MYSCCAKDSQWKLGKFNQKNRLFVFIDVSSLYGTLNNSFELFIIEILGLL